MGVTSPTLALQIKILETSKYPQRISLPSCDERPDRSLHPFGLGHISYPILAITAKHLLFLSSHTRTFNNIAYALSATKGKDTGLPSSVIITRIGKM